MTNTIHNEVFGAALALPPELRATLAEQLLRSLDAVQQAEIDAAWALEVEQRIQEVEQETVQLISGEQVMRELRLRD